MNSPIGQRDPVSIEAAERMLSFVRGVDDRAVWVKMAYVLRDEFGEAGFDMWDEWSQSGASYNAKDARAVWKSASGGTGKRATIGALIALAKEGGWKPSEQDRRTVSPEERAARAREREERLEAERKQAEQEAEDAAAKAADMWAKATPVSDHPYLARKKIEGLAARQIGDMLLIPMKQSAKELCGIQTIGANGTKLFMRGAPVKGAYCVIGKPRDVVVICEGYATGMSIHMATGHCVVVAFNCGNLLPVTEKIKAILKVTIIIAADDDSFLDLRVNEWIAESKWSNAEITRGRDADGIEWIDAHHGGQVKQFRNAGMISAYAAARKTGALLAVPRWYGDRPAEHTDFNDLHCDEGLDAVADCIQAADEPEPPRDHLGDQSEKNQLGESLPPSTKPVQSGGATPVADNTGSTAAGLTSLPVGSAVQENAPVPVILPEGGGDVILSGSTELAEIQRPVVDYYSFLQHSNDKGKPLSTIENLREICDRLGVTVRYNVISKEEEILIPGEEFSVDNKLNASLAWMVSQCHRFKMPVQQVPDYLTYMADQNLYNPVANWVLSKPWDGIDRLQQLIDTVRACEQDTNPKVMHMKTIFIRRWMLSAIAAVFRPEGVSAAGVLVFQGDQYIGKTKWFKTLVPAHLRVLQDGVILRPDDRDSVRQCVGNWLVELGELDATFRKSDIAALKSFLTKDRDVLRRAFARKESEYARRTVFFASVNPREFLHDPTGNRRYWTIECESLDHSHQIDMQQCWAQVHELFKSGEEWYLSGAEVGDLNQHNKDFEVVDPIAELIGSGMNWNAPKIEWQWLSATQVLKVLGRDTPSQSEATRAAHVLREMNGKNSRKVNGVRQLYVPPTWGRRDWDN